MTPTQAYRQNNTITEISIENMYCEIIGLLLEMPDDLEFARKAPL